MNEMTAPLSDEERAQLLAQHDGCLEALSLNRAERRARKLYVRRGDIQQHLLDIGMRIAKDRLDLPVYADAKSFLEANPE